MRRKKRNILTAILLSFMLITSVSPAFADDTLKENTTYDFTNTNIPVSGVDLMISKELLGDKITEADEAKSFRIKYEVSNLTAEDTYLLDMSLAGENAENATLTVDAQGKLTGEVSLKGSETAVIRGLPPKATYRITEILRGENDDAEFIPSYTVDDGTNDINSPMGYGEVSLGNGTYGIATAVETLHKNSNAEVVLKNIKTENHDLRIKKAVTIDDELVPSDTPFEFSVDFFELEPNHTYTYGDNQTFTSDSRGEATVTFSISSKQEMVFRNLPGTMYGAINENSQGYIPKITGRATDGSDTEEAPAISIDSGNTSADKDGLAAMFSSMSDDATLTVTNQRKTKNDLTIEKHFDGPLAADAGAAQFDVTFTNLDVSTQYTTEKTLLGGDEEGITEPFEVYAGGNFTYSLISPDDGENAIVYAAGEQIAEKPIINGTITLTAAEVEQVFDASPDGSAQVNYHTPGTVTQGFFQSTYEGQYTGTISLNANERLTFKNIPDTAIYKITERTAANVIPSYVVTEEGQTGVGSESGNAGKGENLSTPKESLNVDRIYVFTNQAEQTEPLKRVSDTDNVTKDGEGTETDVLENTVPGIQSLWSYRIAQTVAGPVSGYSFFDELPDNVCAYLLDDEEQNIEGGRFLWHTANGSTYGGEITSEITEIAGAEPEDPVSIDERYYVYQGNRKIFEIVGNGAQATGEIEVILLDDTLKAEGGVFEMTFNAGIAPGTKESDLTKSNQKVGEGEYAVTNGGYSLIGANKYRSNTVVTNIPVPHGLSIKKEVGSTGDRTKDFSFSVNLSGLTPGEEYTYYIPEEYKVSLANEGNVLSISAQDKNGDAVNGVKLKIVDAEGDTCGTIRSGGNTTTLQPGTYKGYISYGDADPIEIEFMLEEEGGQYILSGDTSSTIVGGENITFSPASSGEKKISFTLSHGQKIVFPDLPDECIYQITENAVEYYIASYKVTEGEFAVESVSDANKKGNRALSTPEEEFMYTTPVEYVFTNEMKPVDVPVDKISADTGNALSGAHLEVRTGSPDGELVAEWVSNGTTKTVEVGYNQEYYLVEKQAPENFTPIEPIRFRVIDDKGEDVTQIYNETEEEWQRTDSLDMATCGITVANERNVFPVKFEKLDKVTGATVAGATYRLEDAAGNTVATWVSELTPVEIEGLKAGTYTVIEVSPPPNTTYITHDPVQFVLDEDGFVHMTNTMAKRASAGNTVRLSEPKTVSVRFSKQDGLSHAELAGAGFTLYDASGTAVHTWTSDGTIKTWTDIVAGEEYRLHETTAPPYHELQTRDIWFKTDVNDNVLFKQSDDTWDGGEDNLVVMNNDPTPKTITFKKVAEGETAQLPGASVKVMQGEYTTAHVGGALAGYTIALSEKDSTNFTVTVKNGNNAVSGAVIKSGDASTTLTTGANGTADVAKTTYNTKFAGQEASLTASSKTEPAVMPAGIGTETTQVSSWTSAVTPQQLTLYEGITYTYVETAAPEGYSIASPIYFRVNDENSIEIRNAQGQWNAITGSTVTMEDILATANDIVLTKNVTGSLGDKTKEFLFTLTFTGLKASSDYAITGEAEGTGQQTSSGVVINSATVGTKKSNTEFTSNASGNATITVKLKDDQVFVVKGLPANATYAVEEAASDHKASYAVTSSNATIAKASDANTAKNRTLSTATETVNSGEDTVIITFTNHREMATNVGVASYTNIWLVLAAIILVMSAGFFIRRRRTRNYLE